MSFTHHSKVLPALWVCVGCIVLNLFVYKKGDSRLAVLRRLSKTTLKPFEKQIAESHLKLASSGSDFSGVSVRQTPVLSAGVGICESTSLTQALGGSADNLSAAL